MLEAQCVKVDLIKLTIQSFNSEKVKFSKFVLIFHLSQICSNAQPENAKRSAEENQLRKKNIFSVLDFPGIKIVL